MVGDSGESLKGFDVELPEEVTKRARELEFGEEVLRWLGRSEAFLESVERVIDEFPRWRTVVVDLSEAGRELGLWVAEHVEEVEELVRELALALVKPYRPEVDGGRLVVEFRESPLQLELEDVGVWFTDRLVTVEGIVRRVTERRARVEWVVYKCPRCKRTFRASREDLEGARCPRCGREGVPEEVFLSDCRRIVLQELPEEAGEQPRTIEAVLPDDLSYRDVRPGDRVRITGRPRVRVEGLPRPDEEYEFSLEVCGLRRLNDPRPEPELSREELEEILELAEGDPLERVAELVAPHLHGLETIKRAVALQLFSCVPERGRARERVHILIVGDPATAKTQLLQHVAEELAPKGVYVSAQHVTGPGLTAAAVHTEEGWILEAGPAVLADGGLLAIDELDKASPDDLNAMLEAMESGKVSVAKAGITATLNARCAVLAAANPEAGRWQGDHPIEE
ncbi:MAG: AAA family ATPase, partial [Euryarchaeota archaeon]